MAEKVGSAFWDLDLDDSKFKKGIRGAKGDIGGIRGQFDKATASSKNLALGLAAIATGVIGLGVHAISTASDFETMRTALNTAFEGNEEAARKAFETIIDFTTRTPFQVEEVMGAFIKLKNLGLDPSEEALQSYGDTAAAMGKSLDQMVEAVADAATGEFERLKEFGIRAKNQGDTIAFTFQGVTTEVGNNAEEIEGFLMDLGKTKFAGGMEAQSKTLSGIISTLKDNFGLFLADFVESSGIFDLAKEAINRLNEAMSILSDEFEAAGGPIEYLKDIFRENEGLFYAIAGAVMAALVPALVALAASVWSVVAPLLPFIAIGAAIGLLIKVLVDKFGGLDNILNIVRPTIQQIWELLSKLFGPSIQSLKDTIASELIPALQEAWEVFSTQMLPVLKELAGYIVRFGMPILKAVGIVIGAVLVGAILVAIEVLKVIIGVVSAFIRRWSEAVPVVAGAIKGMMDRIRDIKRTIEKALAGAYDAIVGPFRDAFNWIKSNVDEVKNSLDKISPFHKESPSLVDWIDRGADKIVRQYEGMFDSIAGMGQSGRLALVGTAEGLSNATEGRDAIAPQALSVTVNPQGIIARSRSDLRDIMADGIEAVNEELRSRGIGELGDGKIRGSSNT